MSDRDLKLIAMYRHLSRSNKLSGGKRLSMLDALAAIDNLWHVGVDDGSIPFAKTPAIAKKKIVTLLNRLMKDAAKKNRDRIRSRVADRLAVIRGATVKGFYTIPDPSQVKVIPVQTTLSTEQLLEKVATLTRRDNNGNTNDTTETEAACN